jgi:hypothetical protein
VHERALFRIRSLAKASDGSLQVAFLAAVAPAGDFAAFGATFRRILRSYRAP